MLKLAKLGLSPGQVSLALMLIACGLVTYYLLPLAFILNDLALFLGILNSILLGMLLGLTLVAQTLQVRAVLPCSLLSHAQRVCVCVCVWVGGCVCECRARTLPRAHLLCASSCTALR